MAGEVERLHPQIEIAIQQYGAAMAVSKSEPTKHEMRARLTQAILATLRTAAGGGEPGIPGSECTCDRERIRHEGGHDGDCPMSPPSATDGVGELEELVGTWRLRALRAYEASGRGMEATPDAGRSEAYDECADELDAALRARGGGE